MQKYSLNNSFNIYTTQYNNPELVNDDEIAVATYTKFTKNELLYGYDIGLSNNYLISNTIINFDKRILNDEIKNSLLQNYFSQELANNGFMNTNIDITINNQELNLKITLEKGINNGNNYNI